MDIQQVHIGPRGGQYVLKGAKRTYLKKKRPVCKKGKKKFRKLVYYNGKWYCVQFGYRGMPIKKTRKARRKSFCARHNCASKHKPNTPGYQSCLKWNCKVGRIR